MKLNHTQAAALKELIHAAFHILDDAEEIMPGKYKIDADIAAPWIDDLGVALDALDINEHDDIDAFIGSI